MEGKTVLHPSRAHPKLDNQPGRWHRFFTVSPVLERPKENGVRPLTSSPATKFFVDALRDSDVPQFSLND